MTVLDWLIVAATVVFALSGYRRGFVVAALSLTGFVVGAIVGTRIAGALLPAGNASPYSPLFSLLGALVAGGILATGLEGIGMRLRRTMLASPLGIADGVLGAAFSAVIALAIAWVLGVIVLALPDVGSLRGTIEGSAILRRLDELLPPSGALLHAIARIDLLPSIAGPAVTLPAPPGSIAQTPAARRAAHSVVRVLGTACGLGIEGSGWVVAPNEVLTNAHVVAGERDTVVEVGGTTPPLRASVVLFDPRNDLAVLRVSGLDLPVLALARAPAAGTAAAIIGYPEDGPLNFEAGRIGATEPVATQDAYGRGPVTRELTPIRGRVRSGNSGGPLVDAHGYVVTTVFAATTSAGPRGGYGVANSTVRRDLAHVAGPVSTDGCTS